MKIKIGMETEFEAYREMNSQDDYSKAVVDFHEQWATLMEAELESGKSVAECAKDTSRQADTDGITGFMYGCAVEALARFWEHGEELRVWHNLDCQIGDEGERANESGGVLNPAILTMEG